MSACWFDFDNDGKQDIYVANMWVPAGQRVSGQENFHEKDPEMIRALYRGHMPGNSLYRNQGNGKFQNVAEPAGVEMGRWAWSSDAWDFDHDGFPDLYIANGYISGCDDRDVSSFFWRQVVGKSPQNSTSSNYEQGWNAINELIRSDSSWAGPERNVFYANNRDGTFSDVSGVVGMDFPDDSRSFVLADIDHDGRLEVILKNRNAPQFRILRNTMKDIGHSIAFRLRGTKSNRDAIGASVTLEADGTLPDKISAGRLWISVAAQQGTLLRDWGRGGGGSRNGTLAQWVHANIREIAGKSSNRNRGGRREVSGQGIRADPSSVWPWFSRRAWRLFLQRQDLADRTLTCTGLFAARSCGQEP